MTKENVERLIAELGEAMEVPDLALDEDGFVCLYGEDGVVLNIDHYEDQDCLVMYTTVGEIPEEHRLALYDEMLKANFMWQDTLGATLCVSPTGEHALLMISITTGDLDLPQFLNVYNTIGRLTWAWSDRIRAITGEDAATAAEAPAGDPAASPPPPSRLA